MILLVLVSGNCNISRTEYAGLRSTIQHATGKNNPLPEEYTSFLKQEVTEPRGPLLSTSRICQNHFLINKRRIKIQHNYNTCIEVFDTLPSNIMGWYYTDNDKLSGDNYEQLARKIFTNEFLHQVTGTHVKDAPIVSATFIEKKMVSNKWN